MTAEARVSDVTITTSINHNIVLVWELVLLSPEEHAGRHVWKFSAIMKGASLEILDRELSVMCGLECRIADLPDHLCELPGTILRIKVSEDKRKGKNIPRTTFKQLIALPKMRKPLDKNPLLSWEG